MIRLVPMLAETPIDSCRSGESLKESASTVAAPSVVAAVSTHEQEKSERGAWLTQHVDLGHGIASLSGYDRCSCGDIFRHAPIVTIEPKETQS